VPTKPSELDLNDGPARACRLFLVDGNGLMFRAFFALPEEIATSEGFPTNALLGFANMLMKLLTTYRPESVLVCWDEKPTHRLAMHPGYKASRRPTPDLLQEQRPFFKPLVEAFGYRNFSVEGWEADDVIGTLSRVADDAGIRTCVVSTDRDAFQLVSDNVSLMMTPRGVDDPQVYTPERVVARLGIPPAAVADFIGLKGDPGDDIPGVPGIGDKTASELLQQFGSIDGIYEHLEEVNGPKRREALRELQEQVRASRDLGTIRRHLPELDLFDMTAAVAAAPDRSTLKEQLRRFEFRSLSARLDELEDVAPAAPSTAPVGVAVHWRETDLPGLAAALRGVPIAGVAADADRAAVAVEGQTLLVTAPAAEIAAVLADGPGIVAHDFKALPHVYISAGVPLAFDTALAAYLIEPNRSGYPVETLLDDNAIELEVQADVETAHLLRSARGVLEVHPRLAARLEERNQVRLLADMEQPLVPVLAAMEDVGTLVDREVLAEIAGRVTAELDELEQEAYELAGGPFTLGSPKQLAEVLFERLRLPTDRKGKTGYSTDQRVLTKLRDRHPIIGVIERWRELSKLLQTYLLALPEAIAADGRVHTTFSQVTAATGRLSSTNPNLQNIPVRTPLGREIRRAFIAAEGFRLLSADYSQVELRILAHLSREPALVDAFRRGEDVHRATAAEVLGKRPEELTKDERDRAKAVNFGIIYGISSFGLSEQLGIERDEAQAYIDTYLGRYPRVGEFIERTIRDARNQGYAETLFGRRRPIPELRASNWNVRSLGERLAVNSCIQGSAADIIKVAMIACHRRLRDEGRRARLILQIHDELLFEVPEVETSAVTALVHEEMVRGYPLDPPLEVESGLGDNWLEAK
jgi:DNA polymerase-1